MVIDFQQYFLQIKQVKKLTIFAFLFTLNAHKKILLFKIKSKQICYKQMFKTRLIYYN